jgi:hypothetical protein
MASKWQEKKIAAEKQLREEGRWEEFIAYRENLVKLGNMSRPTAWAVAINKFMGTGDTDVEKDKSEKADEKGSGGAGAFDFNLPVPGSISADTFKGKPEISNGEVLDWVGENLSIQGIRPEDCPCAKAWNLLQWARSPVNATDFWLMWAKRIPPKSKTDEENDKSDDGRKEISIIERVRESARNAVLQSGS